MTMTTEQRAQFEALTRPLIKWLNENCHPHTTIVVEPDSAELLEGVCAFKTADYIKD